MTFILLLFIKAVELLFVDLLYYDFFFKLYYWNCSGD
jgi:hypothetical protein